MTGRDSDDDDAFFTGLLGNMIRTPELAVDMADLLVRHRCGVERAQLCRPWTAADEGPVWLVLSARFTLPEDEGNESQQKVVIRKADGAILVFMKPLYWKVPADIAQSFQGPPRWTPPMPPGDTSEDES
ncbi:hypothetical protein UAJ10_26920 [Nitrospirillum sp. BR 11164]|uniref:hypothetical protein n=1 Tax=Nitrospirillum sp. BR 11164 TaxID=3104324 RepID=UPI002AFFB61D|nr:hypothetical protein [Nitrospirillum sp. BR 11164]MEA1652631.1 hypothetical protein [Nitrospirillum sp. BR 11164]